MKKAKLGDLFLLHLIVFIFGFTGILGKLITTDADILVWWRMAIAAVSIAVFAYGTGKIKKSLRVNGLTYAAIGLIIAAHWITFFQAIKVSNVSVTLACLSAGSLFTAILEPLFFRRRISGSEVFLGVMVIAGLGLIFSFETEYALGIVIALSSAFLASLFTVLNGLMIKKDNPYRISLVEMMAGVVGIGIWLLLLGKFDVRMIQIPPMDWVWIFILGTLATAFAFVVGVKVMETLTPFTVSLTINLEPVYGIALAFFIFGSSEKMTWGFYAGTLLILAALYINAMLRKGKFKKFRSKPVIAENSNNT
jgi:drug/metabolite transporter (DMT)-like permease